MRKLIITLAIMTTLLAQSQERRVSLEMGTSTSGVFINQEFQNMLTSTNTYLRNNTSITAGIGYQLDATRNISFKTGLILEQKTHEVYGTTFTTDINGLPTETSFENKLNTNYIIIPAMIKGVAGDRAKAFINLGPFLGVQIMTDVETKVGDLVINTAEVNSSIIDLGVTYGLGGSFAVNENIDLSLEYRRNAGVVNQASEPFLLNTFSYNVLLGVYVKIH